MDPNTDPIGTSLKRINALLAWWGVPKISGIGTTDPKIRRFQDFATDLQTLYGDAAGVRVEALLATISGLLVRCANSCSSAGRKTFWPLNPAW